VLKKNFAKNFSALDADIFCIQEIKMQEGQAELDLPEYEK
jgi:exodeoxyribonuclease-3